MASFWLHLFGGEGFSKETFKLAYKPLGGRVFKSRVNYTLQRANYISWRHRFELQQHHVVEILWVEYTMADTQVSHDSESVLTVTSSNPAVAIEVCNENTSVSVRKNETTMEDKQISKCAPTVNSPNPIVTINICNENAPASESAPTVTSSNPAVAIDICSGNTPVSKSQNEVAMEDEQVSKRLKTCTGLPSSIIDLCARRPGNIFEGDVLVVYGPACGRNPNSPAKAQLIHADLVDKHGQLTIFVTINNNLIARFMPHFSRGLSVRIKDFIVKQRTVYERGDAHFCIHVTNRTVIENVPKIYHNRRLAPNTTIHGLRTSSDQYSVGSIAVIITNCQQNKNQFDLDIKDGQTTEDTALLQMSDACKEFLLEVQHQLTTGVVPMYLLKNIVRNGGIGSRNLRTGMSTFFDQLNDQCAIARLQILAQSTIQVKGVLKAKSAYTPPFDPFCSDCHQMILAAILPYEGLCYYTKCRKEATFSYDHSLHCILELDGKDIYCTLRKPLLQQLLPRLDEITYEQYKQDISFSLDLLRTFQKKGTITMGIDNIITDLAEEQ